MVARIHIAREDLEKLTNAQIREKYSCSIETVQRERREHGVPSVRKHVDCRIPPKELVEQWVDLYAYGMTLR